MYFWTMSSSVDSGTMPHDSTASWNERTSNCDPAAVISTHGCAVTVFSNNNCSIVVMLNDIRYPDVKLPLHSCFNGYFVVFWTKGLFSHHCQSSKKNSTSSSSFTIRQQYKIHCFLEIFFISCTGYIKMNVSKKYGEIVNAVHLNVLCLQFVNMLITFC